MAMYLVALRIVRFVVCAWLQLRLIIHQSIYPLNSHLMRLIIVVIKQTEYTNQPTSNCGLQFSESQVNGNQGAIMEMQMMKFMDKLYSSELAGFSFVEIQGVSNRTSWRMCSTCLLNNLNGCVKKAYNQMISVLFFCYQLWSHGGCRQALLCFNDHSLYVFYKIGTWH